MIDPELRRPVTELDMVRGVEIDGADVRLTIVLTVAGCPLRSSFEEQVAEHVGGLEGVRSVSLSFEVMTPDERAALTTRLRGGVEPRDQPAVARDARDRGRLGQGRRRQVDRLGQPRRGARGARPRGRRARRGHLRPLDPAHARHPAEARRRRQDDRAARRARPAADVDRVLPRRQRAGDVARPDAAPRARAVPAGRALGRARRAGRRHAARHRRRLDLARAAAAARRGRRRDDAAAARAGGRLARGDDGAEDRHAPARRGREHELRGVRLRRRRRASPRSSRCRCSAGCRSTSRCASRATPACRSCSARPTRPRPRRSARSRATIDASRVGGFTKTLKLV